MSVITMKHPLTGETEEISTKVEWPVRLFLPFSALFLREGRITGRYLAAWLMAFPVVLFISWGIWTRQSPVLGLLAFLGMCLWMSATVANLDPAFRMISAAQRGLRVHGIDAPAGSKQELRMKNWINRLEFRTGLQYWP